MCLSVCLSLICVPLSLFVSHLCVSQPFCLSACLSLSLFVSQPICLSACLSLSLFVSQTVYLSVCVSLSLCVSQSLWLSVSVSLSLFVSQSVCCSVCLSLSQCVSHQRACQSNNKVGDSQYCILLAGDRLTVNLRSETANNFVPLGLKELSRGKDLFIFAPKTS